jgi:hypothetical protein
LFEALISILSIYSFILLGFFAKKRFKDELHDKTLILVSIYLLQPMMVFWGLSSKPIDTELLYTPFIYIVILSITLIISFMIGKTLFIDIKDRAIFTISALVPNTGNLGIPLAIGLFGNESIAYTNITNMANLFFMYIFGVLFYSSGKSSISQSLKNIFKIPVIWFALLAIALNLMHIEINEKIYKTLQMGAYASIVIQLIIFGIYLSSVKIKSINYKLIFAVLKLKFILMPIIAIVVLHFCNIDNFIKAIIFMQVAIPLAVNNVNLSALYECKPSDVTTIVFISSVLFIGFLFIYIYITKYIYPI